MSATTLAQALVNRLLEIGCTDAVVAPGSRSGPLARAFAAADRHGLMRLHVRIDEREAAFLALGLAKVTGRATPVVTTSGTAVANLHPAMLEALHASVPLLAVSADRPGRLRGTGANQTTDQLGIFPGVPTWQDIDDIVATDRPGHLNLELDEPLTEEWSWEFDTVAERPAARPSPENVVTLPSGPRTLVVVGDTTIGRLGPRGRLLARDANWPLIAEPSSGARTGLALASGRLLVGHEPLIADVERVVSFGHPTLSRAVTSLLSRDVEIVHVGSQATFPVPAGPNVTFADAVTFEGADDPAWLARWQAADAVVAKAITTLIDTGGPATDPLRVARAVWDAVPPDGLLVVGASNPIRDLDLAATPFPAGKRRKVISNRGLAGIDGVLSTAIGAALGRPSVNPIAYVGDITFLHGSNGLVIGPDEPRPDLTIVVANDDGGSIFASLEQGAPQYADSFERVFATPTRVDIQQLCAAYGIAHAKVSAGDIAATLAHPADGIRVVEVPIRRDARRQLTTRISEVAAAALRPE